MKTRFAGFAYLLALSFLPTVACVLGGLDSSKRCSEDADCPSSYDAAGGAGRVGGAGGGRDTGGAGGAGGALSPEGESCRSEEECSNGFCVDGVCCKTRCDGQCESCNESGSVGTCKVIQGDPCLEGSYWRPR
jgi:hypothetical protein